MMSQAMNIQSLKHAFKQLFNEQGFNHKEAQIDFKIGLIAKYSLGNVNLQRGQFSTKQDINKRREEICHYSFIKSNEC